MFSRHFDVKNQQIVNTTFHRGFVPMVNVAAIGLPKMAYTDVKQIKVLNGVN